MRRAKIVLFLLSLGPLAFPFFVDPVAAQAPQEKRIALVVGDGNYEKLPLPTAANDAGLIAQTLQAAGFDVIGARDLDAELAGTVATPLVGSRHSHHRLLQPRPIGILRAHDHHHVGIWHWLAGRVEHAAGERHPRGRISRWRILDDRLECWSRGGGRPRA